MRKLLLPLFAAAALFSSQASADWTGKDAANATITFKNPGVCTAVVCVPVAQLYDGTNVVTLTTAGADAVSNTLTGVPVYSRNSLWNGTTWDRWTGDLTNGAWVNVKTSVLPTGAATAAKQPALGTAGSASADVLTVQGIASMTPLASNITQVLGAANSASNGLFVRTGSGQIASGSFASGSVASGAFASGALASGSVASGAMVDLGAQADAVCGTDTGTCSLIALQKRNNAQLTAVGTSPLPAQTGIGNVNIGAVQSAGSAYETVAASQTAQVLGATGATGDYLSHCVIYPTSTSPGVVTVFDNTNAAGTNVIAFAGGASSTSNLTPISVPVGAISVSGAWKVTTGSAVSVTCYGKFT